MILFNCDYNEGAHPKIMERLIETNLEQHVGYGEDEICENARSLIKRACNRNDIDVHFMVGGTPTNLTVVSAALRSHQGIIAPATGHISVHETGAIEATGHKVIELECSSDGKLKAEQIDEFCSAHFNDVTHEHMVQPKMVFISQATENGAVYSKAELDSIRKICDKWNLYLYCDGARLGYALASKEADVNLHDMCEIFDIFYIGGTKQGALLGEALVIVNDDLKTDFRYHIKQRGQLFAKGRVLGIQFETLFTDNLYFELATHANKLAYKIADACKEAGCDLLCDSPTNQQFPIMPNAAIKRLGEKYGYSVWEKIDDEHTCIRLCTSWATRDEGVNALINDIKEIMTEYR